MSPTMRPSSLSRREFLKLGGLTAVTLTAAGCSAVSREIAQHDLPATLTVPLETTPALNDPIWRILNRAGYGPKPGDYETAKTMGLEAYLEAQLNPDSLSDTAAELMRRNLTYYEMDITELGGQEEKDVAHELIAFTVSQAITSKRQLQEAMVEFWTNHFNIYMRKNPRVPLLKVIDDREVIRPHALGKFRDLLTGSANSPAMRVYLDNVQNNKAHPNENYAREVMELHTLGVHAGYTQKDVQELARVLTGFGVARRGIHEGQAVFNEDEHDFGTKQVLGQTIQGTGADELTHVLEILLQHPATSSFIATKLVRHFVADDPPASLVERVAQTFRDSDGDIKAMLRVLFLSEEFASAPPKLKRPFTYFISAIRALNADFPLNRQAVGWLEPLGQMPFRWPAPNGYPAVSAAWTANLLPRWNFAISLVHEFIKGAKVDIKTIMQAGQAETDEQILNLFAGLINGRSLDPATQTLFTNYLKGVERGQERLQRLRDSVALLLASPTFQWV